jgi:hypothetical protein
VVIRLTGIKCNSSWTRQRRFVGDLVTIYRCTHARTQIQFRLALFQKNMDILAAETIERATPSSPKYAEWFTPNEVLDLVAPGAFTQFLAVPDVN